MKKLLIYLLVALMCLSGMSMAHTGPEHVKDMTCVLNGFGESPKFQELCDMITKAVDWTKADAERSAKAAVEAGRPVKKSVVKGLPHMFEEKFGMSAPGNHRVLGHGWSLNADIPESTLDYIENTFKEKGLPWTRQDVKDLHKLWANNIIEEIKVKTKLPHQKASSFASLLQNIHLLGDVEPGNTLVDYVLGPEDIQKNIDKDLAELLGKDNPTYKEISKQLKAAVKNAKAGSKVLAKEVSQKLAQDMLNILYQADIGPALRQTLGKTLGFEFTEQALQKAGSATARRLAQQAVKAGEEAVVRKSEQKLTQAAFGKGTAYGRKVAEVSLKAAEAGGKSVAASSVVTAVGVIGKDGSIWIPALQNAAWEGGAVLAIDAGVACYQYCTGSINQPEFRRKLQDAAIKGVSVGGCSAVAVVLGATPGGWVVLGVGFGAYVVTDIALTNIHKVHDSKYLTIDDLADFGITSNTILDIKEDSILSDPEPNTILADPEPNTILADPTPNTILW